LRPAGGGGLFYKHSPQRPNSWYVIGTKVLRVFLLAIHSHLYDFTGDGVSNLLTCIGITICLLDHIEIKNIKMFVGVGKNRFWNIPNIHTYISD
jgi:hypothetical protein